MILGGVILTASIELYFPFVYKYIFDTLAGGGSDTWPHLRNAIALFALLGIMNWMTWRMVTFVNNRFQPRVMADLMNTCFEYVQAHSYGFFSDNFVGSLVAKIRRYPRSFETIADQICFDLGRNLFLRVTLITIALTIYSWRIGLMVFVWALLFVLFNYLFSLYKLKYDIQRSAMDTEITAQLADTVTNNINLKLFSSSWREFLTFGRIMERWNKIQRWTWDLGATADAVQGGFMVILEVAVLWVGVWMILRFNELKKWFHLK